MNDLWRTIGNLAVELHRDRVESIADAIAAIESMKEVERARYAFGPNTDDQRLDALKTAWAASPTVSPCEVAAALRAAASAAEIASSNEAVDLVWTGPKTGLIPTRNTEQVILEVIDSAKSDVFLVTYVFYDASSIVDALNDAIERGVQVRILVESSREHGGTIRGDSVQAMAAAVPKAMVYVWEPDGRMPKGDFASAAVHAKCAVADGRLAFITSANLTTSAMERNMELGVLLRGGTGPGRLRDHLNALVRTRLISEWE